MGLNSLICIRERERYVLTLDQNIVKHNVNECELSKDVANTHGYDMKFQPLVP